VGACRRAEGVVDLDPGTLRSSAVPHHRQPTWAHTFGASRRGRPCSWRAVRRTKLSVAGQGNRSAVSVEPPRGVPKPQFTGAIKG